MAAQISCFSLMYISNVEQDSSGSKFYWGAGDVSVNMDIINIIRGGRLLYEDKFLASMIPFQIAFGFASSYIPFYVFGTIVNNSSTFGGKFIGLCSALVVLVGSVVSLPVHMLGFTSHTSQSIILVVAGIGLAISGNVHGHLHTYITLFTSSFRQARASCTLCSFLTVYVYPVLPIPSFRAIVGRV